MRILFVTVGGSHQPIVKAIDKLGPDRVVFFCTDNDPATRRPGSRVQIEGKGLCIKAHPADGKPTLPNIPAQTELDADRWTLQIVPADYLGSACETMRHSLESTRAEHADADLIVDFTGGTKSMSAALTLAALDRDDVTLQLMQGPRSDLQQTRGESAPRTISEDVRIRRSMKVLLAGWQDFAYRQAQDGLARLEPQDDNLRGQWQRAHDLSAAFAAWHRFDHATAWQLLQTYAPVIGRVWPTHLSHVRLLATPKDARECDRAAGLRIQDLWLNAERCAHVGQHDDAVARLYRMVEALAQWLLQRRAQLDTANLPAKAVEHLGIQPGRDGSYQVGLYAAWRLLESELADHPAAQFMRQHASALNNHLKARNQSILAHGQQPVSADQWQAMHDWVRDNILPIAHAELKTANVAEPFGQLPRNLPEFDRSH